MLRPAGNALKWLFSKPGAVKGASREMMNAGEIAFRILPDAGFGLLTAAQTPGDIFDKAVAGGAQVVGGAGGGLLLGKLGGRNMQQVTLTWQVLLQVISPLCRSRRYSAGQRQKV